MLAKEGSRRIRPFHSIGSVLESQHVVAHPSPFPLSPSGLCHSYCRSRGRLWSGGEPNCRRSELPENVTEQAERPSETEGECRCVDICGPKWPAHEPKARISRGLESTNLVLLQRFSRVERVTGIEPALSAWEEFISSRVSVSCNDIGGLS